MIKELVDYGIKNRTRHQALKFEPISIDLIIDTNGSFKSFVVIEKINRLAEALTVKKGNSRLLLDRAEEVLGYVSPKEIKNAKNNFNEAKKRVLVKHNLFLSKLDQYKELELLKPILHFYYDNATNGIEKALSEFESQIAEKDHEGNIAFRVGDIRIHEQNEVYDAIIQKYEEGISTLVDTDTPQCSICGRNNYPIARLHEKIKGLPPYDDGKSSNRLMISYNKDAFLSYSLTQSSNSGICTNCAKNYADALNELIEKKERRKNFGSDTAMVYWTRENTEMGELDLLDKPDPALIGELINSVTTGKVGVSGNIETNRFYSMTLSGAAARIAVRDWIEMGLNEYRENIASWFEEIAIWAFGQKQYTPLYAMANSCHNASSDNDPTNSRVAKYLWEAALKCNSIPPLWILASVLKRIRLVETTKEGNSRETMTPARAALIRFILNRNNKNKGGYTMLKEQLDLENKNPAFVCGRIFAVMEGIQRAAIGKEINAGIRERFFSAASTNPITAFGRLMKLTQNHLTKLSHDNPSAFKVLDIKLREFCSMVNLIDLPKVFTLEDQGVFAFGYYQQKQKDYDDYKEHEELKNIIEEE